MFPKLDDLYEKLEFVIEKINTKLFIKKLQNSKKKPYVVYYTMVM